MLETLGARRLAERCHHSVAVGGIDDLKHEVQAAQAAGHITPDEEVDLLCMLRRLSEPEKFYLTATEWESLVGCSRR